MYSPDMVNRKESVYSMETTSCGNQKIKESIDAMNNFSNTHLSFINNTFQEKKGIFLEQLKVDYELEKDLLEQIYILEEKLFINFRSSNWPRGYRLESLFSAEVVFDIRNSSFKEYKDYFIIRIWEDLLAKKKHRVFFYFPQLAREVHINDIFKEIGKEIIVENDFINSELNLLGSLTIEELSLIGNSLSGELPEYELAKISTSQNLCLSINPYIKLLKNKHNFILKRKIENDSYSLIEGTIYFEPLYKSKSMAVFNEITKYALNICIYGKNINNIYFSNWNHRYSLTNVLNYAGIEKLENINEFEHLIILSNYDLNVISLLIDDMIKNKIVV